MNICYIVSGLFKNNTLIYNGFKIYDVAFANKI